MNMKETFDKPVSKKGVKVSSLRSRSDGNGGKMYEWIPKIKHMIFFGGLILTCLGIVGGVVTKIYAVSDSLKTTQKNVLKIQEHHQAIDTLTRFVQAESKQNEIIMKRILTELVPKEDAEMIMEQAKEAKRGILKNGTKKEPDNL